MALQEVRGGGKLDIPTVHEIAAAQDVRDREQWRGIKDLQLSALLASPAGTHITVNDGITPSAGYKWVIRLLGIYLAAAGTGQAFITSDTTSTLSARTQSRPVAAFTNSGAYQVQTYGNGALILDEGEGLYLNFTQNVAGYILNGWMIPAEKIGRFS